MASLMSMLFRGCRFIILRRCFYVDCHFHYIFMRTSVSKMGFGFPSPKNRHITFKNPPDGMMKNRAESECSNALMDIHIEKHQISICLSFFVRIMFALSLSSSPPLSLSLFQCCLFICVHRRQITYTFLIALMNNV